MRRDNFNNMQRQRGFKCERIGILLKKHIKTYKDIWNLIPPAHMKNRILLPSLKQPSLIHAQSLHVKGFTYEIWYLQRIWRQSSLLRRATVRGWERVVSDWEVEFYSRNTWRHMNIASVIRRATVRGKKNVVSEVEFCSRTWDTWRHMKTYQVLYVERLCVDNRASFQKWNAI